MHKCPYNLHGMHPSEDIDPVTHVSFDEMSQLDLEYRILKLSSGHCFHVDTLRDILKAQPGNPRCPCTNKPMTAVDIGMIKETPTWPGYIPERSDDNMFYQVLGPLGQLHRIFRLSSAHLMHPPGFDSSTPNGWPYSSNLAEKTKAHIEVENVSRLFRGKLCSFRIVYMVAQGSTSVPLNMDEGPGRVILMELSKSESCDEILKALKRLASNVHRADELYTLLRIVKKDSGSIPVDHRNFLGKKKPDEVEDYLMYIQMYHNRLVSELELRNARHSSRLHDNNRQNNRQREGQNVINLTMNSGSER